MEQDLHSKLKITTCISPAAIVATTNGAIVDSRGYESLEYVLHVGTAMVGGGFDVTLEEGDDSGLSDVAAVPAAEILGALPSIIITDADMVFRVGSIGKKRYQRLVLTETGTITGGIIGVVAVQSHPVVTPEADQSTST